MRAGIYTTEDSWVGGEYTCFLDNGYMDDL